ncbi:MAG: site-specific integrase, partial [Proteobacteria bacterium]|nr:site-specific integrase [Pseudomonadota bacterium]
MRLDTRSARLKLAPRREPYWRSISQGLAIGYRRGKKGGTWVAKHYTSDTGRRFNSLGTADDVADADGANVFDFAQAQERARAWFAQVAREDVGEKPAGPCTVRRAIEEYLDDYKVRSGRALQAMEYGINAHILPELGDVDAATLTTERLRKWHNSLATSPARLRTAKGGQQRYREASDEAEAKRQRKVTANKILTILKAALNYAYYNGNVTSDDPWRRVKPFKKVDEPKVRYLTESEAVRLVNACTPDFRQLVRAA